MFAGALTNQGDHLILFTLYVFAGALGNQENTILLTLCMFAKALSNSGEKKS